jgi:hypothetical protein
MVLNSSPVNQEVPVENHRSLWYGDNAEESELPLEKMRVFAFLAIPADATPAAAKGWLLNRFPNLNRSNYEAILRVHMEDNILRAWRLDSASPERD